MSTAPLFLSIFCIFLCADVSNAGSSNIRNHIEVVAAIDFGTAQSGGAFSSLGAPNEVYIIGEDRQKVPTCITLKKVGDDYQYTHFGKEAQDAYHAERQNFMRQCEVKSDGEIDCLSLAEEGKWDDDIYYFDRFKMALYDREFGSVEKIKEKGEGIVKDIPAKNGKLVPSKIVIREALRYFKDRIIDRLSESGLYHKEHHIQWVITIPGMWSDEAKQFMRLAAFDAGMGLGGNLMFALEPEAAALFVMDQFKKTHSQWKPGMKYCVVDAGGGTIDFICHVLDDDMRPQETHHATGDKWGSTYLDQQFDILMTNWFTRDSNSWSAALMKKLFKRNDDGSEVDDMWRLFKNEVPEGHVHLLDQWTKSKHQIKSFDKSGESITLPASMTSFFGEDFIKSKCLEHTNFKYCYMRGRLTLPKDIVEAMYMELITPTIKHIKYLLQQEDVKGTEYLFLVGGFGQSEILQKALKDAFEPDIELLRPNNAGMAVLYGALSYGHNPAQISARRARFTYGIKICTPDISACQKSKIEENGGIKRCCDVFDRFVEHNQVVKTNEVVSRRYFPQHKDQKVMGVTLLTSHDPNVKYVDESGVSKKGEIHVPMEGEGIERNVDVKMEFGSTIIKVTAEHEGVSHEAEIEWFELQEGIQF